MVLNRYLTALLSLAITILTALVLIPSDQFHLGDPVVGQLIIMALAAIGTYIVPLLSGRWAGGLKTGLVILAAILSFLWPLLIGGHLPSGMQWVMIILTGLQALATEVGVQVRVDDPKLVATVAEAGPTNSASAGMTQYPNGIKP